MPPTASFASSTDLSTPDEQRGVSADRVTKVTRESKEAPPVTKSADAGDRTACQTRSINQDEVTIDHSVDPTCWWITNVMRGARQMNGPRTSVNWSEICRRPGGVHKLLDERFAPPCKNEICRGRPSSTGLRSQEPVVLKKNKMIINMY